MVRLDILVQQQGKHFCGCPCHGEIIIKKHHRYYGIPKFIIGHRIPKKQNNKKNCLFCKKEFSVKATQTGEKRKFCSVACKQKYLSGINSPNWKGGKLNVICLYCGKQFKGQASIVKKRRVKYCSRECSGHGSGFQKGRNSWQKGRLRTLEQNQCQSKSLKNRYKNGLIPWNKGKKYSPEECKRLNLDGLKLGRGLNKGKPMSFEQKEKLIKSHLGKFGELSSNWKGGLSFEPYPSTFNRQLKDKIKVRDNFKCRICGVPELECIRQLDIHHIDYNKKNCSEDNLISLCVQCHMKTNGRREYWKEFLEWLQLNMKLQRAFNIVLVECAATSRRLGEAAKIWLENNGGVL